MEYVLFLGRFDTSQQLKLTFAFHCSQSSRAQTDTQQTPELLKRGASRMITDPVVGAEVQSMRVYVDTLKDELKEKTDENVRCDATPSFVLPNVCVFLS